MVGVQGPVVTLCCFLSSYTGVHSTATLSRLTASTTVPRPAAVKATR